MIESSKTGATVLILLAERYGDPQLIAQIKTTLENKLREALGDEYEQ